MKALRAVFYALAIWRLAPAGWRPYLVGFVFGIPAFMVVYLIAVALGTWTLVIVIALLAWLLHRS